MVQQCAWKSLLESLEGKNYPNVVVVHDKAKLDSLRAVAARLNAQRDKPYRYEVTIDYPQCAAVVTLREW